MVSEKIRILRERTNMTQSELAKRLSVTRSSVNAWESGLSVPTSVFIVELAKVFHVSTDYLLGLDSSEQIDLSGLSSEEKEIVCKLVAYFDKGKA